MRYEHITLECIEGVATITINRPEVLNALSMQTLDEMMDALDSVAAMGARTLLLRGAGRAFCSGADLSGGVQEDPERIDRGRALETGFNPLLESMVRLPIPIVSAVSGALLQRLAAVRGRLSLCADQAAAAKWWLSMPMASVSAEGPMPKALSTRRTSPLMPGCRHQGRACPLRRARMTSNPLIVA
jgi:enoyl-CoA hydratase/carnithine racemase